MTKTSSRPLPGWLRGLMLLAIPVVALGMLGLGFWQLGRLEERRARNALITARLHAAPINLNTAPLPADIGQFDYQAATVRGIFDPSEEIVWRNRALNGAPGVDVITPLRLAGSDTAILVNRGWISYLEAEPPQRARYAPPAGEVTLTGWLRVPLERNQPFLPLDPTDQPRLSAWFWLDIAHIQRQMPYPLLAWVFMPAPPAGASAPPIPHDDIDLSDGSHLAYAVQWFAFAVIAGVGPVVYWWRNRRG